MYELLAKVLFSIKALATEEPVSVDQDICVSTRHSLCSSRCAVQKKETSKHI